MDFVKQLAFSGEHVRFCQLKYCNTLCL